MQAFVPEVHDGILLILVNNSKIKVFDEEF